MNNGYILTCWLYIWNNVVKHSLTYKVICKMYNFMHSKWQASHIANIFRKSLYTEGTARNSLWGRVCFLPFILIERVQHKKREQLTAKKESSGIVRVFNYLIHNILALNLRFMGTMLFSASLIFLVYGIINHKTLQPWIISGIISLFLTIPDINITEILSNTKVVTILENLFDTKFSFNYFYLTKCEGKARIFWAAVFGVLSGIIGTSLSPLYSLGFIGVLFLIAMILYKTEFGICITVFLAPHIPTSLLVFFSVLCFVSLVVRALTSKKFTFRTEGVGLMIIIMIIIFIITTISSYALTSSLKVLWIYIAMMLFYFSVLNTVKTKKQLLDIIKLFVFSTALVCINPFLHSFCGLTSEPVEIVYDLFGYTSVSLYSPILASDGLGMLILLVLPLSVTLFILCKTIISKMVFLLFSIGFAAILTAMFSQSYFLGLIVSAVVFITFAAGKLWGLALLILPILPFILPENIPTKIMTLYNTYDSVTSYRASVWAGTLEMLKDFWISGVGLGNDAFNQVYPFYAHNHVAAQHPYNLYLNVFSESGIFGFVIFLFLLLVFFKKLATGYGYLGKGSAHSMLTAAIGAAVSGFLVNGMFNNSFYNSRIFMLFWFILALGISVRYLAKEEAKKQQCEP